MRQLQCEDMDAEKEITYEFAGKVFDNPKDYWEYVVNWQEQDAERQWFEDFFLNTIDELFRCMEMYDDKMSNKDMVDFMKGFLNNLELHHD